jgi:hypothetical protein
VSAGRDRVEQHLLTHAAALGGWFTVGYVRGNREPAMDRLVDEGLFVQVDRNNGRTPVYELTERAPSWRPGSGSTRERL